MAMGRGFVLLSACLLIGANGLEAEGLASYGQRLCDDAGVARADCTLGPPEPGMIGMAKPAATDAEVSRTAGGRNDKSGTLDEHARELCDRQGVAKENCQALRPDLRKAEPVPVVVAEPRVFGEPGPERAGRRSVSSAAAPAPPYAAPVSYDRVQMRDVPFEEPYAAPPPFRVEETVRYVEPPIEAYRDMLRYPAPADPGFAASVDQRREAVELVGPAADRGVIARDQRFRETTRYFPEAADRVLLPGVDRAGLAGVPVRCLRSIRYSAPPSYRYVDCTY